ncbi:hypothetical protein AAC387_Pa03g0524 [Persea americana]
MSSNPSPPTTTAASQSDSKTQISHETSPRTPSIPTSQSDSKTQKSHETPPRTPPIPHSQSDIKPQISLENLPTPPELGLTDQATKDELFKKVMQEDWDAVVNIYLDKGDIVSTAKITRNKETTLHIAISDNKTKVVKALLYIINPFKIQEMLNDMDENPLHLAASLGQAEMCKQLVEKDPKLIGARNKEGETPLFQATLYGKKAAFYALHPRCPITGKHIKHDIVHCKRTDGNSILHVAIQREYFAKWAPKWEDVCKIFNKDVEKHQLPVRSTGKDKKQAPEEPSPEESSKHCDHSHIDIEANPGILRTPLATIVEASSISRDDDNKSTAAEGTAATDAEGLGEYDATLPSVLISSAEVPGENDAAFNLATNSADVINVISPLPSIASPPSSTGKPSFISSSKRNS